MSASKAQRAFTADRRNKAIQMRLAGADWDRIADALDYASRGAACADVTRALEANIKEGAANSELLRETNRLRMERLLVTTWQAATTIGHDKDGNPVPPDPRYVDQCRKLIESMGKMYGIGTTMRIEHITVDQVDAEIARLTERMAENARRLASQSGQPGTTPA